MADDVTTTPEFQEALEKAVSEKLTTETDGLRKNRDDVLREKKQLQDKLKGFEDVDLDEYKNLKAAADKAKTKKAADEGDWKKLETQLLDQHSKAETKWKERETLLTRSLEKQMVERAAVEAIAAHKGSAKLLLPIVRDSVKIIEQGGEHRAVVVNEKGDPQLATGAKDASDFMTIEQYVETLKGQDDYARAFDGSGASGGGASGNETGGGAATKNDPVREAKEAGIKFL